MGPSGGGDNPPEEEYRLKGARLAKVTYQFVDNAGTLVQGVQKNLPVKDDPRSNFVEHRMRVLGNRTVLFDPRNSKKSILYPTATAELRR